MIGVFFVLYLYRRWTEEVFNVASTQAGRVIFINTHTKHSTKKNTFSVEFSYLFICGHICCDNQFFEIAIFTEIVIVIIRCCGVCDLRFISNKNLCVHWHYR